MLIIRIKKGDSIDISLKKLKTKFKRTKIADELKDRMFYKKKSEVRREIVSIAKYRQKLKDQEDNY